ncbi:MAG: DUF58 domain-containing protein [Halioglobus sp.]|nr:DUF58 domain-containing protein [Halioglobus sp.]
MTARRGFRQGLRKRFREWVNRRIPAARSVTLDQRRIFIFPSRTGLFFTICLIVMLMTAINYQNNMSYALTFLLCTLFVVAILHTYANLSGLTIRAVRATPVFPGQQSEFSIQIERGGEREHFALHVQWPDSSSGMVNLVDQDAVQVQLRVTARKRGWFSPGRLLLESTYPLGLMRCWTWVDLDLYAMVYPRPLPTDELPGFATDQPDGAAVPSVGSDDFYGFREYRHGDSLRQLYWKGLARGQGLQTKQYGAYASRSVWLDWEMFPGAGVEQRLSYLCHWVLQFEKRNEEYGLRLPGLVIEAGVGERHRDRVLQALALYGVEGRSRET